MGSKEIVLFLVFFTYLLFLPSSFPLHKAFVSDCLQDKNSEHTGRHEHEFNGVVGDGNGNGRSDIAHINKYGHAGAAGGRAAGAAANGGANGGGSTGATESGNGNGNTQGGAAVIPVIVAGAANNNRHQKNHHGAASCNKNCIRFPIMIMSTLATFILHLCILF